MERIWSAFWVILFSALILYLVWTVMSTIGDLPPFIHKGKIILGGGPGFHL